MASSRVPGMVPGSSVKSPESLDAIKVSPNSGPAQATRFAAALVLAVFEMFAAGNEPLRATNLFFSIFQLTQEKVPSSTAAAAKPQPANAATRYDLIVLCLVRNSCRKRISTRDAVSASLVRSEEHTSELQ